MASVVILLALLVAAACGLPRAANDDDKYKLPEGFLIGGGTSAYQTEGAWNQDGKGVNVFDNYYHTHSESTGNGDVASDSYNRYKEDIDLAAELGFNVFRLSISWTRILPDGRTSNVNAKGVQHYHDVLAELKAKNIEPIVTLCHFDYPQVFEDEFGGWLGDKMQDVFAEYADFVFNEFGSEVKYWLTLNEVSFYCTMLGGSFFPPYTFTTTERQNACIKNSILAHAKAYKIYEEKYKAKFNGLVGFGSGPMFSRPATDAAEDIEAAESANVNSGIGLTIDPLVFGDYPEGVRATKAAFTDEEKQLIKGRIDFVGINMYGGSNTSASGGGGFGPPGDGGSGWGPPGDGGSGDGPPGDGGSGDGPPGDGGSGDGSGGHHPGGFGGTESAWVLRVMPLWIKNRYDSVKQLPIFITENGVETSGETSALDDWDTRAVYCSAFLREMVAGIHENQTRVFGYTAWSLVDTYEFRNGFSNWGLIHVDFASGSLNRTLKASSTFFKTVTKTGFVPLVEEGSQPFPDPDAPATSPTTNAPTTRPPTKAPTSASPVTPTSSPSGTAGLATASVLTTLIALLTLICLK